MSASNVTTREERCSGEKRVGTEGEKREERDARERRVRWKGKGNTNERDGKTSTQKDISLGRNSKIEEE